jgi:hypothetical protein
MRLVCAISATSAAVKVIKTPLLFPTYVFVLIELQWNRWSPGVVRLEMDGITPAAVPDAVVTSLKAPNSHHHRDSATGDLVRVLRRSNCSPA